MSFFIQRRHVHHHVIAVLVLAAMVLLVSMIASNAHAPYFGH
jgi:hypothetical protein